MRAVIAVVLAALAAGAGAQERVDPAQGVFLVATGEIDGGPFYQSVLLLLSHDSEGTLGLIVNRRTKIPLSEVRPDDGAEPDPKLYFGGPVGLEGLLVLFRSDRPMDGAEWVMDDLYYSGSPAVLKALLESRESQLAEPRLFIGHSGWAPGQLDSELHRGSWDVVRADVSQVFGPDTESLWDRLTMSDRVYARVAKPNPKPPSRTAWARSDPGRSLTPRP